jgi:hypothetical protein
MKCRFSVRLDVVALAEKSASLDNPSEQNGGAEVLLSLGPD